MRLDLLGEAKGADEPPHGRDTSEKPPELGVIKSKSVPFVFSTPRTQEQWAREAEDEGESEDQTSQFEPAPERCPSPSNAAMQDELSKEDASVHVEERVELALVSSKHSQDQMIDLHLRLEELVAEAVGFLRVDRIQIILGPMDSARSLKGSEEEEEEERTYVVLVIGLESGVSMDASMRTLDVAEELVRQAKDVCAPLRLSLSEIFGAAVLGARLLSDDEPARTAGYYTDLQRTRLEFVCHSISTKRKASMTGFAWRSWVQEHRRCVNIRLILHFLLSQHRKQSLAAGLCRWQDSTRQQKHFKGVCKHIILSWLSRCLAMSFAAWRRSSLDSRRLKEKLNNSLDRWLHATKCKAWDRWLDHCQHRRELRAKVVSTLSRWWLNTTTSKAWGRWMTHCEERKIMVERLNTSIDRWLHATKCKAWDRWLDHCQHRRRLRAKVASTLSRWLRTASLQAYNTWRAAVEKRVRRQAAFHSALARLREISIWRAFTRWRVELEEKVRREAVLFKVLNRMRNHMAWRALSSWSSKVDLKRHTQDALQITSLNRTRSLLATGWFWVCTSILSLSV